MACNNRTKSKLAMRQNNLYVVKFLKILQILVVVVVFFYRVINKWKILYKYRKKNDMENYEF